MKYVIVRKEDVEEWVEESEALSTMTTFRVRKDMISALVTAALDAVLEGEHGKAVKSLNDAERLLNS